MTNVLDLTTQALVNGLVIEASAGTGKTYSVAALIVREIALAGEVDQATGVQRPDLSIAEILVTTFTRNAAAELRDRVRRRLVETAHDLQPGIESKDELTGFLATGSPIVVERRRDRIVRAIAEYDSATIATIHSICSKVLTLAGESAEMGDEDQEVRIVAEVVNDVLLAERSNGNVLDGERLIKAVRRMITEPDTVRWFDHSFATGAEVHESSTALENAVDRVVARLESSPSFSYLVTRAHRILVTEARKSVIAEFQRRYRYVIVDEAQDTDGQQWRIFRAMFPLGDTGHKGAVVAVGDPKQSIYRFRGADVDAYTDERAKGTTVSLTTNFRSDARVIAGLNDFFTGVSFGGAIPYQAVVAAPANAAARTSLENAVEIVKMDEVTEQQGLAVQTARRVAEILNSKATIDIEDHDGVWTPRRIMPSDVVVLVRSSTAGLAIERGLRRLDIPAVSAGTSSVMASESAEHWRVLLAALERLSNHGRVRHALSTPLFGVPLTSPALFDDSYLASIQDSLFAWAHVLRSDGVAALAARVMADPSVVIAMSTGDMGERRLTDFSHVADLLHAETGGGGCTPTEALEAFTELSTVDPKSELVSRRVESDSQAVQIMTIHVSKGLEFPIVVVADMWNTVDQFEGDDLPFFRVGVDDGLEHTGRTADIGWLTDQTAPLTESKMHTEFLNESARLLYVAATRAKHHVTIMKGDKSVGDFLDMLIDEKVLKGEVPTIAVRNSARMAAARNWTPPKSGVSLPVDTGEMDVEVERTYVRTSFTGIMKAQQGRRSGYVRDHSSGTDEGSGISGYRGRPAGPTVPDLIDADENGISGVAHMARIPGGTNIGTILHSIYERIDPAHPQLEEHVRGVVAGQVTGQLALLHGDDIARGIVASLRTPLGTVFGDVTLASIGTAGRAAELNFEMAMIDLSKNGIKVSDIGRLMTKALAEDDILMPYARSLSDPSFDIGLGGLINGSIDALLLLEGPDGNPRLVVSDYKSNRLDKEGDTSVLEGYGRDRMLAEMEHHHYPLQAVIYGTAVYRMVRARRSAAVAESTVAGFAYLFVRGMIGPDTPEVGGHRAGVFTWTAPEGFWSRMSDFFAGIGPS